MQAQCEYIVFLNETKTSLNRVTTSLADWNCRRRGEVTSPSLLDVSIGEQSKVPCAFFLLLILQVCFCSLSSHTSHVAWCFWMLPVAWWNQRRILSSTSVWFGQEILHLNSWRSKFNFPVVGWHLTELSGDRICKVKQNNYKGTVNLKTEVERRL